MAIKDLTTLPADLPVPVDDGACDHLLGARLPSLLLPATSGASINLATLPGLVVLFFYPMTGRPDSPPLIGWNEIPGARGCTPQNCGFRDHYAELIHFGATVFGVSAQSLADQQEAKQRLALPFELLNDSEFALTKALQLPTFDYQGARLIKRLALVVVDGVIRNVFYPVFPPDRNAEDVIAWLDNNVAKS